MTSREEALPKLRVTRLICTEGLPQWAHRCLEDIGCDNNEFFGEADFGDGLRAASVERGAGDNVFEFTGSDIALAFCDLARENDVFEVKDREVVIFKLLCGVRGYNIVQCTDQVPKLIDYGVGHAIKSIKAAIM